MLSHFERCAALGGLLLVPVFIRLLMVCAEVTLMTSMYLIAPMAVVVLRPTLRRLLSFRDPDLVIDSAHCATASSAARC
ncbi:hypothetical protein CVT26_012536 [Gymnopilus dilepis]|uniref:Uncharacterized protein n=1 Tax=Gymnopilus dilepis TaxID=231916 RepID=A0A409WAM8_9AGAR|nr:hypothetical protein CVT26_012536 [Gymnopilus dilepis]